LSSEIIQQGLGLDAFAAGTQLEAPLEARSRRSPAGRGLQIMRPQAAPGELLASWLTVGGANGSCACKQEPQSK